MGFPPITDCEPVELPPLEPVPQRWTEVVEEEPLPAAPSPAFVDVPYVRRTPQRAGEILPPLRPEQDEYAGETSQEPPIKQAEPAEMAPQPLPEEPTPAEPTPLKDPTPPLAPAETQAPVEVIPPLAREEPPQLAEPAPLAEPSEPFPPVQPRERSKTKIGLAIALAAAVLLVASAGGAWYAYVHRSVASGAAPPASSTQSAALSQAGNGSPVIPAAPMQSDKPSPGTRPRNVPSAPQALANPAHETNPAPPRSIAVPNTGLSGHGNPAGPTPTFRPAMPVSDATAQGRSGVRHYQGPPVPYGGVVVFDNLPKERLRFTFDNTAWRLIIKPNPDGSKKVILNSLKQGYQTYCDLSWERIE